MKAFTEEMLSNYYNENDRLNSLIEYLREGRPSKYRELVFDAVELWKELVQGEHKQIDIEQSIQWVAESSRDDVVILFRAEVFLVYCRRSLFKQEAQISYSRAMLFYESRRQAYEHLAKECFRQIDSKWRQMYADMLLRGINETIMDQLRPFHAIPNTVEVTR